MLTAAGGTLRLDLEVYPVFKAAAAAAAAAAAQGGEREREERRREMFQTKATYFFSSFFSFFLSSFSSTPYSRTKIEASKSTVSYVSAADSTRNQRAHAAQAVSARPENKNNENFGTVCANTPAVLHRLLRERFYFRLSVRLGALAGDDGEESNSNGSNGSAGSRDALTYDTRSASEQRPIGPIDLAASFVFSSDYAGSLR